MLNACVVTKFALAAVYTVVAVVNFIVTFVASSIDVILVLKCAMATL